MPGSRLTERGLHRFLALTALCERTLGDSFVARAAGTYGWGIALSYVVAILLDPDDAGPLLEKALMTLAWIVGGVLALWSARDTGALDARGVSALASERGFDRRTLAWAHWAGTARRIARAAGVPGTIVALVAASRAPSVGALEAARWVVGAALVAVVLGLALATLARAAALFLPERGRLLLLLVVLLPLVAGRLWPEAPSAANVLRALVPALLGGEAT